MSEAVPFGSMEEADAVREEYSEHVCPIDDDKRQKTVAFVENAPEGVMDQVKARAQETRAEDRKRAEMAGPLSQGTRDQIKEYGGFGDGNTTFSWRRAKGVFAEDGSTHRFNEMLSALADYDDPVEGARQELKRKKEASAARGTSNLSGARDRGEEDIQEDQDIADAARTVQSEGCDHARDHCEHGDQEACEFLKEACGYDDGVVSEILAEPDGGVVAPEGDVVSANADPGPSEDNLVPAGVTDDEPEPDELGADVEDYDPSEVDTDTEQPADSDAIGGKAAGALSRSWSGYRAALSEFGAALDRLRQHWTDAQQAAQAINAIRVAHGQDPMHFEALEGANADVLDYLRQMARDCEECHADHSEHGHDTDAGPIEDVRQVVGEGADVTPVGIAGETAAAIAVAPDYHPEHFSDGERVEGRYEPDHGAADAGPDADAAAVPSRDPDRTPETPAPAAPEDFERFVGETPGMRNRRESAREEFREQMERLAQQDAETDPDTPDGSGVDLRRDTEAIDPRGRFEPPAGKDRLPLPDEVGAYTKKRGLLMRDDELGAAVYTGNGEVVRITRVRTGNGWWATRNDSVGQPGPKGDRLNRTERGGSDLDGAIDAALDYMQEHSGGPDVMETREQRDLSGDRDPQARLAGGETGGVETEIESTPEENSGGLLADTRENTGNDGATGSGTEQATPDAFQVAEGGQNTLGDMAGGTEINDLAPAIEELEAATDGYGDRISMDNELRDRLADAGYGADAWTEQNSQDVFRYGIAAGDVRDRLPEDPETRAAVESILIDLANEQ